MSKPEIDSLTDRKKFITEKLLTMNPNHLGGFASSPNLSKFNKEPTKDSSFVTPTSSPKTSNPSTPPVTTPKGKDQTPDEKGTPNRKGKSIYVMKDWKQAKSPSSIRNQNSKFSRGATPTQISFSECSTLEEEPFAGWDSINFYASDNPTNILMEGKEIKGAKSWKLISKLTSEGNDVNLLHDFLLTYRSFLTSTDLMEALIARYSTAENDVKLVRLRVYNFMKQWVEKYWDDFSKDKVTLEPILNNFLQNIIQNDPNESKVAQGVKTSLKKKIEGTESKILLSQDCHAPMPYLPKDPNATVFDMHPEEVARQLTVMEWRLWSVIKPWECLGLAWTKKDKEETAKHVLQMSERFNYVSSWVAKTICITEQLKDRAKVFIRWIEIANKLMTLQNFNGVMEIISGLHRGPVSRLAKTIQAVQTKEPKIWKIYLDLEELTDQNKNYANLRKALKLSNPPLIPYLGMYLTDLTFVEEGNPDYITEHKLVNFHKRRLISQTINQVQQYQLKNYNLADVLSIQLKLQGDKILDEDELYECSQFLEPRAGKQRGERPVALGGTRKIELEKPAPKIDLEFKKEWQVYYIKDSPAYIVLSPEARVLKATLPKMIERLSHPTNSREASSLLPILSTYKLYTTSKELLELIITRYNVPEPKDKSQMQKWVAEMQLPIQTRTFNIIKQWISYYRSDFDNDPNLLKIITNFTDSNINNSHASAIKSLLQQNTQSETEDLEVQNESETQNILEHMKFLDLDPTDIARQITLSSSELYIKVKSHELLISANIAPEQDIPFSKSLVEYVESLENWVIDEIENSYGMESQVITHLIAVLKQCESLNNWEAIKYIVRGIDKGVRSQPEILRVHWEKVDPKDRAYFFELLEFLENKNNESIQEKMVAMGPPAVPIMECFVTTLKENKSTEPFVSENLINFQRLHTIGEILNSYTRFAKLSYQITRVPLIQDYLRQKRSIKKTLPATLARWPIHEPRNSSTSLSTSSSNLSISSVSQQPNSPTKYFVLDLLFNDEDFKSQLNELIKEVVQEEMNSLTEDFNSLEEIGIFNKQTSKFTPANITNQKVNDIMDKDFPNLPILTFNVDNLKVNFIDKGNDTHIIYNIITAPNTSQIAELINTGKLYRHSHPHINVACILFSEVVPPSVQKMALFSHVKTSKNHIM